MAQMYIKDHIAAEHSMKDHELINKFYDELPIEYKGSIIRQDLTYSALLHDIGKLMVPNSILKTVQFLTKTIKDVKQF